MEDVAKRIREVLSESVWPMLDNEVDQKIFKEIWVTTKLQVYEEIDRVVYFLILDDLHYDGTW